MWKRLRRRSMTPSRPALYPDQIGLALVVAIVLWGSLALVAWLVAH